MDPLSIAAATIGTADVTFRLSHFLKGIIEGARDVDRDLLNLLGQVESLASISKGITNITCAPDFEQTLRRSFRGTGSLERPWEQLWLDMKRISTETKRLLEKLEAVLKEIQGGNREADKDGAAEASEKRSEERSRGSQGGAIRAFRHSANSKIESIRTQLRKDSKSGELKDIREQLGISQNALETCLTMINLGWSVKSHHMTSELLNDSKEQFISFMTRLQEQIATFERAAPPEAQLSNLIFQAPAASDLFTGRLALLNQVEEAFGLVAYPFLSEVGEPSMSPHNISLDSPLSSGGKKWHSTQPQNIGRSSNLDRLGLGRKQKRFILVGLGGSGKTEFCRKFAEQNQSSFWGVFWIDATSDETAQHSYKEVARVGGVDENIKAAMTWLAGLAHPWLLVIDNADDPNMEVEKYFPGGERGHILVTTRRPALKNLGTVGRGFCELEKLDETEAHDLLLKHAQEEVPWAETARSLAKRITEVLGYLPLALVCAGKAIAEGITTLADYIAWFDDSWDRIRLQSRRSGRIVDETNKNVFAPYEAMLQNLSQEDSESARDAIELLKLFSFLHHENITLDIMVKAARNPPAEEERLRWEFDQKQQQNLAERGTKILTKPKPWRRRLKDRIFQAVTWYEQRVLYPVLPSALRNEPKSPFSVHRLRAALTRLNQKSLITARRKNGIDMYSIHPLIHRWVRERPQMSIGERGLWCQAAVTMLNQCIPLPPLGGGNEDVAFRRQLLPHFDAVRKFQKETQQSLEKNQKMRQLPSFLLFQSHAIDRPKVQQYARFSRIYSECGRFHDTEELQVQVKDYAISMLGLEDDRTTLIMLALSGTYWALTRVNDAAVLQNQALSTCNNSLGPNHPRTLKVMDALGKSECFWGRYKEARKLHEDALSGMQKVLPADHEDIFLTMSNLATVWQFYFEYEKAEALHTQAVAGLTKALGKDYPDTLIAQENLAMTYLEMTLDFGQEIGLETGADSLQKAYTLEYEVLETRRKNLGKENNWTLWAICNLARIKSSLGHLEEAEMDMWPALEAGTRNLGEEHCAVLAGKTHLARVIAAQKRYDEAEGMFQEVVVKSSYGKGQRAEGESPDHLLAVWYYAGCCQQHRKLHKAIELLKGISGGLSVIGAKKHKFWERVENKLEELEAEIAEMDAKSKPPKMKDTEGSEAEAEKVAEAGSL